MTKSDLPLIDKVLNLPYLLIALAFTVTLSTMTHFQVQGATPYVWVSSYGLMFLLAYEDAKSLYKLALTTLIASALAVMMIQWPNSETGSAFILIVVSIYAINSFHITYHQYGFKKPPYQALFHSVWDTLSKLLIAALFLLLCWIILQLWSGMFNLININFFDTLFSTPWFLAGYMSFTTAIGLLIAIKTKKVTRNIRAILLLICKWLLPVLVTIGTLFIISWLFTQTSNNSDSINLLLFFTLLTIIFINGVYQNGEIDHPYPKLLTTVINVFLILLPVFPILAFYLLLSKPALTVVPLIPGNNTPKLSLGVNIGLLLAYTLTYAWTSLKRESPWLNSIKKFNINLALFMIIITCATNNYLFKTLTKHFFKKQIIAQHQQQPINQLQTQYQALHQRLLDIGFSWKNQSKHAVIVGYRNNQPLYLCQKKMGMYFFGGTVRKNTCQIIKNSKVINTKNFTILNGPQQAILWKPWPNYYQTPEKSAFSVVTGFNGKNALFVCRVIFNNRIYIGTNTIPNNCLFIVKEKLISAPSLQYLYAIEK